MISSWLKNMILGSISVEVSGKLLSALLNQMNRAGISLWNVKRKSNDIISFTMNLKDFKKFRSIVRNTASKFTIKRKFGLPFLQWRLSKRYMFMTGFLFFLLFIWTMSQFIWDIKIVGHDGNSLAYEHEKIIRNELVLIGIKEGSWKRKIPEKDFIQSQLREQLQSDYIWIGMDLQGTQMSIIAVPLSKPKKDKDILLPSDFVSTKQAVIHKILAYEGIAYVHVGQRVYPGQILISGYLGAEKIIPAKGVVEGVVWYTVDVELPIERKVETYTGDSINKYRFVFKEFSIPLYLPNSIQELKSHDIRTVAKKLAWRSLSLPLEFHIDTYHETKTETIRLSETESEKIAVDMAVDAIKKQANFKEVVSHTIMKYNVDNEQSNVKLLVEVIEDIAVRRIITDSDYADESSDTNEG